MLRGLGRQVSQRFIAASAGRSAGDLFGLRSFLRRLCAAFGWKYVAILASEYGVNQGTGLRLAGAARSYYLLDSVGMSSADYGHLSGFSHIPWQLKSVFGLLSDTVALGGLHRTPYLLIAGAVGVTANTLLAVLPGDTMSYGLAALLFLGVNLNVAMADVMIDATVAERSKERPELAADMQALCWGSLGAFGVPAALLSGVLLERAGPRLLFAFAAAAASSIAVPASLGWLGERQRLPLRIAGGTLLAARRRCAEVWQDPVKRSVASSALLVSAYSIALGSLQVSLGASQPALVGALTVVGNLLLCLGLFLLLRVVDGCLARALVYAFLQNALCPSSSVLFEWSHAPANRAGGNPDDRCWSADECAAAALNATALVDGEPPLPCGWARERGAPCLSPVFLSMMGVVGSAALVCGTALYTSVFQPWPYRRIIGTTQLVLVAVNFVDLAWVARLNIRVGIPDALFVFGDEVLADIVERLNAMPFFIFAAKLCPPTVEASMFALFMGLSNFGYASGSYLGSAVLNLLGGVAKPDFPHLHTYILLRSLMRLAPIALVPFLVPRGSPSETAAEMGAGAGVTGSPGRDDDGDGGARQRSESDAVELCASSSSTALADLEADDGGALKRRCE